jgi:hypothetical protein
MCQTNLVNILETSILSSTNEFVVIHTLKILEIFHMTLPDTRETKIFFPLMQSKKLTIRNQTCSSLCQLPQAFCPQLMSMTTTNLDPFVLETIFGFFWRDFWILG